MPIVSLEVLDKGDLFLGKYLLRMGKTYNNREVTEEQLDSLKRFEVTGVVKLLNTDSKVKRLEKDSVPSGEDTKPPEPSETTEAVELAKPEEKPKKTKSKNTKEE